MECDEIKRRLNANFPMEMQALDVYVPEQKLKNVAYAEYEIKIHSNAVDNETPLKLKTLFSDDVFVTKKSKGNEKEINIKDFIHSFEAQMCDGDVVINTVVCSGSDKNLNPELVVDAIRKNTALLNGPLDEEFYSIMRKEMLTSELTPFK